MNLLDIITQLSTSGLGRIETFLNPKDVPISHIPLDGRTVLRVDFVELGLRIAADPEGYSQFTLSETRIQVPDWTGYYLKSEKSALGEQFPDTIRRVTGQFYPKFTDSLDPSGDTYVPSNPSGVFRKDPDGTILQSPNIAVDDHNNDISIKPMAFDLETGVYISEQEANSGKLGSDFVGDQTEPKNVHVIFAIQAKGSLGMEALAFVKNLSDNKK